jgi:amino acid transporter
MGELASMAPTAGGQYHWVSILAPASIRNFLSYIIGWLTMIGWQAIVTADCFLCAQLVQGLVVMNDPNYMPQPWQTVLLYWGPCPSPFWSIPSWVVCYRKSRASS